MSRFRLKLATAAVFLSAWARLSTLEPLNETAVFQIDPPTPYIHYVPADASRGRVLVVHGLDVSKETTKLMSQSLADGGFEVYNIDLPGHGGSAAGFEAGLAQKAILNVMRRIGEDTIVLGHSLGAGLLLDLAENRHFSTMVLLSPPPLSITRIQSGRTLIATGAEDVPRIRTFVPIATDIGGPGVEAWILPWAAHSAPIFNPVYVRRIVNWLGGNGARTKTLERIVLLCLMLSSAVVFGITLMPGGAVTADDIGIPGTLVRYIGASFAAVLILKFVNPFWWLRLFATDYLIGFLFVAGICLIGTRANGRRKNPSLTSLTGIFSVLKALAAAAFVIVVLGWVTASNVLPVTLSGGRWWRFPCIVLASLPLLTFDELTIRRIHSRWKSFGAALVTRALFWAFLMLGALVLSRQNAFLVLIIPLMVLFWIGLWLAAGVVHKHTNDPFAAALFAALVQGWAFAAWFVLV